MVGFQPSEMRLNGKRNFARIFHGQKMPNDLGILFGLAWQPQRRIALLSNFTVRHYLNNLRGLR